jgi:ubiquinone/menaquinone biosynthesis C-methylase UbiE
MSEYATAADEISRQNAEFWNELCGSGLAKGLGIADHSLDSLKRFDEAYLKLYPYLLDHVPAQTMRGRDVLEVGLGFGTLGQIIAQNGARYTGMDIAEGPVRMMIHRLAMQGVAGRAIVGNMLVCPFPDESFDRVVSIGCFHHTGSIQTCLDQTYRILRPGGQVFVMVYNALSFRRWRHWPGTSFRSALRDLGLVRTPAATEVQRAAYDISSDGTAAPETEFVSIAQLRRMMRRFSSVRCYKENSDHIICLGRVIPRDALLSNLGRWMGLDIYVHATK